MHTKIYSVFPGVGKTYFTKHSNKHVLDIDSSQFDKQDFPSNYIKHIKEKIGTADIILISCHISVIEKLLEEKIDFTLIYPDKNLKDEYIERYKKRNDSKKFINSLTEKWGVLIGELEANGAPKRIILKDQEYLSDII